MADTKRTRKSLHVAPVMLQSTRPGTTTKTMRMSMSGGGGGMGGMTIRSNVMGGGQQYMGAPGQLSMKSKQAVGNLMAEKNKEKKDISSLNERLAEYINQRGYADSKCKMLEDQVEELKKVKFPNLEHLREEYLNELAEQEEALNAATGKYAEYEATIIGLKGKLDVADDKNKLLETQNGQLEEKITTMTSALGDMEGELQTLRLETQRKDSDNDRLKENIARLEDVVHCLQMDLDAARTEQIKFCQLLETEKTEREFDCDTLKMENDLLREQLEALKKVQPDCKKYFSTGFKDAVAELRATYDDQLEQRIASLQSSYESKIAHMQANMPKVDKVDSGIVKSEVRSLKSKMSNQAEENAKLLAELDAVRRKYEELCRDLDEDRLNHERDIEELRMQNANLNAELCDNEETIDQLSDCNLDLKNEIEMYSKLLNGPGASLKNVIEHSGGVQSGGGSLMSDMIMQSSSGGGGGSSSQNSNPDVSKPKNKVPGAKELPKKQPTTAVSQTSGRVNLKKTSRGQIQYSEIRTDGQYCEIECTGRKDIDLTDYCIVRKIAGGGRKDTRYTFPEGTIIKAGGKLRIYGNAYVNEAKAESGKTPYLIAARDVCNSWPSGDGKFTLLDANDSEKCTAEMTITR